VFSFGWFGLTVEPWRRDNCGRAVAILVGQDQLWGEVEKSPEEEEAEQCWSSVRIWMSRFNRILGQ
jgi:hypothetical protein